VIDLTSTSLPDTKRIDFGSSAALLRTRYFAARIDRETALVAASLAISFTPADAGRSSTALVTPRPSSADAL
jgi:hypothetical protein